MTLKKTLLLLPMFFFAGSGFCAIRTELVDYMSDGVQLQGALVFDDSLKGTKPGIIVYPSWVGRGEYVQKRAEQLAGLGYVAFAADLYGKGKYAKDHEEAAKLANANKDRPVMRTRALAAVETLRKSKRVDPNRIAAIGYCFGGTAAIELARSGTRDVKGVVAFHGGLDTKNPEATKPIAAKVLALSGADDKNVTAGIPSFQSEMNEHGADWQLVLYSQTVHSFTDKGAGNDPSKGSAYNEMSDKRSWLAMRNFFDEIFN